MVVMKIEISVNKTFCFVTALDIPYVHLNNYHVRFWQYFDYSWFRGKNHIIKDMRILNDDFYHVRIDWSISILHQVRNTSNL